MAEEIDVENGRNSNFEGLVTLTFDPAIRHIVLQQSSTSTYIPTFIQIEETFCGRTDVRTDGRTFFPSILLGRLSEVDLIINGDSGCRLCTDYTHSLSRLAWSWVGDCLAPFYIHQMNRMNSDNGSAMTTAPETLARIIRSTS